MRIRDEVSGQTGRFGKSFRGRTPRKSIGNEANKVFRNPHQDSQWLPWALPLFFVAMPAAALAAVPAVPPQPLPTCDASVAGRCYNQGGFTLSAVSQGAHHYRVCRSHDTSGWGGCNQVISQHTSSSLSIEGEDLPADGFRRAYYWSACDAAGQCTQWKDNPEVYVYRDMTDPAAVSVETDPVWVVDEGSLQVLTVTAADSGSGVGELRVAIDLPATGGSDPRGMVSWRAVGYRFAADQMPCVGGGFASKHPAVHNPTTVTLVGCSTTSTGDRRTVAFELRPNPTFGALPAFDVSLRAWDRVGSASRWARFDLDVASVRPNDRKGERIGYQGIVDATGLAAAASEGIGVNLATLLYQRKQCAPFYWPTVDTAGILSAYRQRGVQAMVILENFLFRNVNDPQGDDCQLLDPPPPLDPSLCFADNKWRLFPDWRARLDAFVAIHGPDLVTEDIAFFLVSSEVNDRCFDLSEVEAVALAVRDRFPTVPLAMIYGATHRPGDELESQPPPPYVPAAFDVVGLFSYEVFDVNDPLEPRNATARYYDPQQPENLATIYGDLLAKLHDHQRVLLVFDANLNARKESLGWQAEDLAAVAHNYADFMAHRPEATMMGGFTWQGLLALPQSVRDAHRTLACERFDNLSSACPAP